MTIDFELNPLTEDFRSNCADYYRRLLRERPVAKTVTDQWLICRHQDVHRILTDHQNFERPNDLSIERKPEGPLRDFGRNNMVSMNAPEHTRFRQSAARAFTPKTIRNMRPSIEKLVDHLLDSMASKDGGDFIREFAFPLPIYVICEMMGISHEDHDMFGECTAAMLASLELSATEKVLDTGSDAARILFNYCQEVARKRETSPGHDLISLLIEKEREDKMQRDEVIWAAVTMLIAGHETTTHMLGNGMLALVRNPQQYRLLEQNPSLAANATEEILRYDPTLYVLFRRNIDEVCFGEQSIPAGSFLIASLYAANHDPDVFEKPEVFDIQRTHADRHLTFAAGRHLCLGHSLARLEGQIAFSRIFQRVSNFQLSAEPVPRNGLMFKGNFSMPMSWSAV